MTAEFYIKQVDWSNHAPALRLVRQQVFIQEQAVPEALEWDGEDATAIHLLAVDTAGESIGCARIVDHHIGRMAVLKDWRGHGVGKALLNKAIQLCKIKGDQVVMLSAQTHAVGFYQQAGFTVSSEPYLDADIWHVDMKLTI